MTPFQFCLYVLGQTPLSTSAESQLRSLLSARLAGRFELEVIDLAVQPDRGEAERIVATPTLDRIAPLPRIRLIGNLASVEQLSIALDLPTDETLTGRAPGS